VSTALERPWLPVFGAAVVLAVVTFAITWPLFQHPSTQVLDSPSLYGPASVLVQRDINLTLWILAWDSHALVTDPLHLFHANALYPRWSLATSEHMLGNVPVFALIFSRAAIRCWPIRRRCSRPSSRPVS
jgi:hypothetical protein